MPLCHRSLKSSPLRGAKDSKGCRGKCLSQSESRSYYDTMTEMIANMGVAGEGAVIIFVAVVGVAVGSFLNVCIDRLPVGQSLVRPPSHCPACQRQLSVLDLIPVFSYLWLRGRCRYCRAPIGGRVLAVEAGTGLLFAFIWWSYGFGISTAITAFYGSLFLVLAVIDLERGIILNKIVYPTIALTLLLTLFCSISAPSTILCLIPSIFDSLIGGMVASGILLLPALVYKGSMGWGDVKMAALVGLVTGFPLAFVALLIAMIAGGLIAALLLLLRLRRRKDAIPFGPFLSFGTLVTLFWGSSIFGWYLQLLS